MLHLNLTAWRTVLSYVQVFTSDMARQMMERTKGRNQLMRWKYAVLLLRLSRGVPMASALNVKCQAYASMTNHVTPAIIE